MGMLHKVEEKSFYDEWKGEWGVHMIWLRAWIINWTFG